jgi:hypothetical protein
MNHWSALAQAEEPVPGPKMAQTWTAVVKPANLEVLAPTHCASASVIESPEWPPELQRLVYQPLPFGSLVLVQPEPTHTPPWHASPVVVALLSSHVVPSGRLAYVQVPLLGRQTPPAWH